ncbi:MAG: DUF362 domain-containing protein [Desulfobacterales bacterium]|nr:DUF362 domain-containing protein [Desulfobacterales bacterium]
MHLSSQSVALRRCAVYCRRDLKQEVDRICNALSFTPGPGSRVLLKPNLVSARPKTSLACTHPQFVAAVAEWFIDHGARVMIGDSPAFGSARQVMKACGITKAVAGLPVRLVNFRKKRQVVLRGGVSVGLAARALDCDLLINLPKVKAHCQVLVTLAVKNYFGVVVGARKSLWHMRFGGCPGRFSGLILDLLDHLPNGITLADGIIAMQGNGPMAGRAYPLGLISGSTNPVALDTALGAILGIDPGKAPLQVEAVRRGLAGCRLATLSYPLLDPDGPRVDDFDLPEQLRPLRFEPFRILAGGARRLLAFMRPGR